MPTRSIQELSEERGAQRLRVFDLDELGSATNGFSRALKLGEGGFGSVYRAFFRSVGGGRVVLAVKRLNQRSLQVSLLPRVSLLSFQDYYPRQAAFWAKICHAILSLFIRKLQFCDDYSYYLIIFRQNSSVAFLWSPYNTNLQ
jgi:hypothetical protein